MSKMEYRRSFTILHPLDGANPVKSGFCKMEVKGGRGRLSFTVQGFEPREQGLHALLVERRSPTAHVFDCGWLQVDPRGVGTLQYDFDPERVGGIAVDDYHALCICQNRDGVVYPLAGSFGGGGTVDWHGDVEASVAETLGWASAKRAPSAAEAREGAQSPVAHADAADAIGDAGAYAARDEAGTFAARDDDAPLCAAAIDDIGSFEAEVPYDEDEEAGTFRAVEAEDDGTVGMSSASDAMSAGDAIGAFEAVDAGSAADATSGWDAMRDGGAIDAAGDEGAFAAPDGGDGPEPGDFAALPREGEVGIDRGGDGDGAPGEGMPGVVAAPTHARARDVAPVIAPLGGDDAWRDASGADDLLGEIAPDVQPGTAAALPADAHASLLSTFGATAPPYADEWPGSSAQLKAIFEEQPRVDPFHVDACEFVRVSVPEGLAIDHYVLGVERIDGEIATVCYAIPGGASEAPPPGLEGYQYRDSDDGGYWVMWADALTGEAVAPTW